MPTTAGLLPGLDHVEEASGVYEINENKTDRTSRSKNPTHAQTSIIPQTFQNNNQTTHTLIIKKVQMVFRKTNTVAGTAIHQVIRQYKNA